MKKLIYLALLLISAQTFGQAGIGLKTTATLTVNAAGDSYATHQDSLGRVYYRTGTLADRNALPALRRYRQMMYYVVGDSTYRLQNDLVTWKGVKYGDVTKAYVDSLANTLAPKNSPAFTGTPTAPTPATGTNTNQLATTSGVRNEITSMVNKNLGAGYGVNSFFYNPLNQPGNISIDTTVIASKSFVTIGNTQSLQRVTNVGSTTTNRIGTPGIDGSIYHNFTSQSGIPMAGAGQNNFGFVNNSLFWNNGTLGYTRTLRQLFLGNTVTRLPYLAASTLADSAAVANSLALKLNIADTVSESNRYVHKSLNETVDGVKTFIKNPVVSTAGETSSVTLINPSNGYKTVLARSVTNNSLTIKTDVSNQGAIGAAISFNPTNVSQQQYATASDAGLPTGATPFIISLWFKTTQNLATQPALFQFGDGTFAGSDNSKRLIVKGLNNNGLYILGAGLTITGNNPTVVNDGMWHLFTATFNGTTIRIYTDGVQRGTTTYVPTGNAVVLSGTAYIGCGRSTNANGTFYQGAEQQLLIYNATGYTDAQLLTTVTNLYGNGQGTPTPPVTGLLRRYDFNNTSVDGAGNANATLVNTPIYDANGLVSAPGSIQLNRTAVEIVDGGRGGFYGTHIIGDPLGLGVLRGTSAAVQINNTYPVWVDAQGHTTFDPAGAGSATIDANRVQSLYSVVKIAPGSSTVTQLQLAPTLTHTATANQNGGILFRGTHFYGNINGVEYQLDNNEGGTTTAGTTYQITASRDQFLTAANTAQVVYTLPTTSSYGDVIEIAGQGSGGWKINQNAGDKIQGGFNTTTGAGGSLTGLQGNSIRLRCIVASTGTGGTWFILSHEGALTAI